VSLWAICALAEATRSDPLQPILHPHRHGQMTLRHRNSRQQAFEMQTRWDRCIDKYQQIFDRQPGELANSAHSSNF